MSKAQLVALVLFLVVLLVACAPQAVAPAPTVTPPPAPAVAAPAPAAPQPKVKAAWEAEWEKTLAVAKAEGTVVIYTSAGGENPRVLNEAFKKKHGITTEFVSGRGGQMVAKVVAERRAGLYLVDVHFAGITSTITELKPTGALDDLRPAFILPDVKDPKTWLGGQLPWADNEKRYILNTTAYPRPGGLININMVKSGELVSHKDLLNPKWVGKIIMHNPTVAGVGQSQMFGLIEIMGVDYIRELAKQKPVAIDDQRLVVEWVVRGKYPLALFPLSYIIGEFQKLGSPIEVIDFKEGTTLAPGSGGLSLYKNAPHPNAARVFINWLLSKEGQTIFARVYNGDSTRLDIDKKGIEPLYLRQPGMKYFDATLTEDHIRAMEAHKGLIKELFPIGLQ